ncbi:MAG: class II fructose-bisphosphate aldolase [Anaerolineae bacterium]|nr:class II fructose-bisphosphate aldolase [Anaerolineae bacterium]
MTYITQRTAAAEYTQHFRDRRVAMAIFCTASHWNTEAILLAAQRIGEKYHLHEIPVAVAMTGTYPHMPQMKRATYSGDARVGFLSMMTHLRLLTDGDDAPYRNVVVLPHLDHHDPVRDRWTLTEGVDHVATVMFDAQTYPLEDNIAMTREYVQTYGKQVLVEGIIEELSIAGQHGAVQKDDYIEKATAYMAATGVDFIVADLGTEQQSDHVGGVTYLKQRARELTSSLGDARLVLHGTSSLSPEQMQNLADDGVIRVNMWTRIVREAGQVAARRLFERREAVERGDFEATESHQYLTDSVETAADIMVDVMELLGYARLGL